MKLSQIILPEIILGRRGHPKVIEFYRQQMNACKLQADKDGIMRWCAPAGITMYGDDNNDITANHMIVCRFFRDGNGESYYIPKAFAQALSRVDREIPIDILSTGKREVVHLQFASGALKDDTGPISGAIVVIDTIDGLGYRNKTGSDDNDLALSLSYYGIDEDHPEMGPTVVTKLSCPLSRSKVAGITNAIDELNLEGHRDPEERRASRLPVYRAIINALIYLRSADPEIMKLRPLAELTNKKRVEEKHRVPVHNELTVPISVLNWGYHEGNSYSVDSSFVQTHMRWQRCGPGLSQVKLVWVREHERRYKKGEENGLSRDVQSSSSDGADSVGPVEAGG